MLLPVQVEPDAALLAFHDDDRSLICHVRGDGTVYFAKPVEECCTKAAAALQKIGLAKLPIILSTPTQGGQLVRIDIGGVTYGFQPTEEEMQFYDALRAVCV